MKQPCAFERFVVERPWIIILLVLGLTGFLVFGLRYITLDTDMTDDIPSDIPEKAYYDEVGQIFPSDDFLFVAVVNEEGIFSAENLSLVKRLSMTFERIPGVSGVISVANAGIIRGDESGIIIEGAMDEVPKTSEEIEVLKERLNGSELTRSLIGVDGKATAILITLKEDSDELPVPRLILECDTEAGFDASVVDKISSLASVKRVLAHDSEEADFTAKVNYLTDLSPDRKGRTRLLIIPEEDISLEHTLSQVKPFFAGEKGIRFSLSDDPVPSYYKFKAVLAEEKDIPDGTRFYLSGTKAVSSLVGKLLISDLSLLFPVVLLIIIAVLFLSFKTVRGVVLPLSNVLLSVIWAMGLMGYFRQPISMATMILPIILIAVGTAYTIHVINRFYEELSHGRPKRDALLLALVNVRLPIFLAGITTVVGFASLALSTIKAMAMYGILAALGIGAALVLSLTFTPAVLALLPEPKLKNAIKHNESRTGRFMGSVGTFTVNHPKVVVVVFSAIIIVSLIGIPLLKFETNTINSFKKNTEIRQSTDFLNKTFTGITVMKVIVKSENPGNIYAPKVLRAMDGLESYTKSLRINDGRIVTPGEKGYEQAESIVGGSQSIVSFVKGINRAIHEDSEEFNRIPDDQLTVPVLYERYRLDKPTGKLVESDSDTGEILCEYSEDQFVIEGKSAVLKCPDSEKRIISLENGTAVDILDGKTVVSNLILLYSASGDPEDLEAFVDNNVQTAAINIFIKSSSSTIIGDIQEKANEYIETNFPEGVRASFTGLSSLTLTILRLLVDTQIWSIITSLGIIFILMSLISRSLVQGIFSIIPLTGSLVINFGIMGWSGIPIDISTATIASIAIGIGVDYTIHFLERYKAARMEFDEKEAVVKTLSTTGQGILFNAAAVAGGFLALTFSQVQGNVFMGILMAVIMLTASIGAVTLLPALLVIIRPGFIRDDSSKMHDAVHV